MKKMTYLILGIILLSGVLVFTGRKSVHHEIIIQANPDEIWNVLTNMEAYPEWNPTMELLEGSIDEGTKVRYKFTQDENTSSEIDATVYKALTNELLNQKGGIPLVLTFNHKYLLKQTENNTTKVIIHEDYRGIGVNFWDPQPVEEAYKRLNLALKERVEKTTD